MLKHVRVKAEIILLVEEDNLDWPKGWTAEQIGAGKVDNLEELHDDLHITVLEAKTLTRDEVLWGALQEMDGWDGVLTAQQLHDYLAGRDGGCPWTVEELETWLADEEEKAGKTLL